MAQVLKPREDFKNIKEDNVVIFLAGNMGNPWREEIIKYLESENVENITAIDPTVEDWGNDVGEEREDNEKFLNQTRWEHLGLLKADIEVFYFDASSLAPISLLEFGLFKTPETILYVEDDYEKSGYLKIIAQRFGLSVVQTMKELKYTIQIKCNSLKK